MPHISEEKVTKIIDGIDPSLRDHFICVYRFLIKNPESGFKFSGKSPATFGSEEYFKKLASKFVTARVPKAPKPPETIPDELVSFILKHYFDVPEDRLQDAKREHALSMGAENMIGDLLERYVAHTLEVRGWVWCSGAVTRSIDFIKPGKDAWIALQIKNRDNSENSSSSSVRDDTDIIKWHRTFSKKEGTNWSTFPDENVRKFLNEEGFHKFVKNYLEALKNKSS